MSRCIMMILLLSGQMPLRASSFTMFTAWQPPASSTALANNNENKDDAQNLREQAAKLRQEVASFEDQKASAAARERQEQQEQEQVARKQRERYSAVVPILKPDGSVVDERCDFRPLLQTASSTIMTIQANLPLGLILGESEMIPGATTVDEVAPDSNGQKAGLRVGDVVRACTACRTEMDQPTWQLLVGGIGQPKTVRFMYSVDYKPFDEVMEAIGSNRMDPEERPVLLVIERNK